jgi:hypothetical protein
MTTGELAVTVGTDRTGPAAQGIWLHHILYNGQRSGLFYMGVKLDPSQQGGNKGWEGGYEWGAGEDTAV